MRPGPDPKATRWIAVRVGLIGLLFLAGFAGVAWRAVQLQVVQRDRLSSEARDQYLRQFVMKPRRGVITDRAGVLLAGSADAESVFVDPEVLADRAGARSAGAPAAGRRPRPRLEGAGQEGGARLALRLGQAAHLAGRGRRGAAAGHPRGRPGGRDPALLPEGHAGRAAARRHRRRGLRPGRRGAGPRRPAARRADPRPLAARRRRAAGAAGRPGLGARARGGARRADHRPGAAAGDRAGAGQRRARLARPLRRGGGARSLHRRGAGHGQRPAGQPQRARAAGRSCATGPSPTPSSPAPPSRPSPSPGRSSAACSGPDAIDCSAGYTVGGHAIHDHGSLGWMGPPRCWRSRPTSAPPASAPGSGSRGSPRCWPPSASASAPASTCPASGAASSPSPGPTSRWPPRASARGSPPRRCRWSPPWGPSPTAAR